MKVYITARGLYQVQNANNYSLACFDSLVNANAFIRENGQIPVYTWFN